MNGNQIHFQHNEFNVLNFQTLWQLYHQSIDDVSHIRLVQLHCLWIYGVNHKEATCCCLFSFGCFTFKTKHFTNNSTDDLEIETSLDFKSIYGILAVNEFVYHNHVWFRRKNMFYPQQWGEKETKYSQLQKQFSHKSCDGRVVKAMDLKSIGLCPHRFEPCRQRSVLNIYQQIVVLLSFKTYIRWPVWGSNPRHSRY